MAIAYFFPGQGSQSVGMLAGLADLHPVVRETFAEASAVLGYDLWHLTQQGPATQLDQTEYTQPAMLVADVAVWRAWRAVGGSEPAALAGHSLGEYAALVCAEALNLADAVRLVRLRAQAMQAAVPTGVGSMAAVLGLADAVVVELCTQAAQGEVVAAVNFNAPGQIVIAGHKAAVERASQLARTAGAKRVLPLAVSVPAHTTLMQPVVEILTAQLATCALQPPRWPVWHNVDATPHPEVTALRTTLAAQVARPVLWTQTVQALRQQGMLHSIECGPGKILQGLQKRIAPDMSCWPLGEPDSFHQAWEQHHAACS